MASSKKPVVWTIAGSDSGGGAGIQADLSTLRDFGVFAGTVITAVTAQNSFAVGHIAVSSKRSIAAQINALDSDLTPQAIKIGMLGNETVAETVANYLEDYPGFVVLDPVLKASSGDRLINTEGGSVLRERLLPRVSLITPNRNEAEALLDRDINSLEDVPKAAEELLALGVKAVLITGGHFDAEAGQRMDYFSDGEQSFWLQAESIASIHTHGSGCTLSSAIAGAVAKGYELADALVLAKAYVTQGIRHAVQMGSGPGAVAHIGWTETLEDFPGLRPKLADAVSGFADCGELGFYPVLDSAEWIARLADSGITTVQLRVKDKTGEDLAEEIRQAVALCEAKGIRLFINDYWQEAIAAGAYGVHLGQEDLDSADLAAIKAAGLRLGVSTHCYYEVARAHALAPSYIAIGPIYDTTSKDMPFAAQGVPQLQRWVSLLGDHYPMTAIGGISQARAKDVLATGVGSVAVISAVTMAEGPEQAVADFLALHN